MKKVYGIDIETHDPCLKEKGVSWVYKEGEILCTAVYDAQTGKKWAVKKWDKKVRDILLDEDAIIVGAKIDYDIGWLQYEMGIKIKASPRDIFFAEALIDEYGVKDLDTLGKKYLKIGKKKSKLEEWCKEKGLTGDFRQHLKYVMECGQWPLIEEYVLSDAELPVKILEKQLPILTTDGTINPFMTDCKLIPIVLKMKETGVRLDLVKRDKNYNRLEKKLVAALSSFENKYKKVNFNSNKQMAAFFDEQGAEYNVKFTLKGRDNVKYEQNDRYITSDLREAFDDVEHTVTGFRFKKKKLVLIIEKKYAKRVKYLLDKDGFMYTANAMLDAKALVWLAEKYPVANEILKIKKMESIIDKFLGPEFKRFIGADGRLHADFNISKSDEYGTISGRFSMSNPNLQQVPSKGESDDIILAEVCRELFIPEDNCWLLKIDYSQIEYRLLIHYAVGPGADAARARFLANPYTDYHKFVMELTGLDRKRAKNCNFGIMYGMGIAGMMDAFGWSRETCEEILEQYHSALPYVKPTMEKVRKTAEKRGWIRTIGGRVAHCVAKESSYAFLNRLNQGGSADIMKSAMVAACEQGIFDILIPHITVHDELVCSVPKTKEGLEAVTKLRYIMEHIIPLNIPIIAEPELGNDWYHVDTRYVRTKSNGTMELVSACMGDDEDAVRKFLGIEDDVSLAVKTKKGTVKITDTDVVLKSLDGDFAVVTKSSFDKTFKEVA